MGGVIRRSTLREQLADALREEILAGRLAPGREFTVREIAEQYGVSATPVREALLDLAAQGLLHAEQHRGFRIREYTLTDFRHMVQARSLVNEGVLLYNPALRLPRGEPAALTSIRRRAAAAQQAAASGDLDVLIGYDLRFWREVTALIGNPYVGEFLDRLRIQCWAYAVPRLRGRPDLPRLLWGRHPELAEALQERDAATAAALLRDFREHALTLAAEIERETGDGGQRETGAAGA
ncbi:GntR family transcriptional regulator [Streptomyces sp. YIM 98790]|uniref:GntR family transcriptional regulator n=1 Tax=Streptomyces sp. YIM 98790 TaxID=2689077 RepID=UPI001A9D5412